MGAYEEETLAFVNALNSGKAVPCTGEDGLVALVMAMAAGKSAIEGRWVKFDEIMLPSAPSSSSDSWVSQVISASGMDTSSQAALEAMLQKFDIDKDQDVDPVDLKQVMSSLGRSMNDEELGDLIKEMDTNQDGHISYVEFLEYMGRVSVENVLVSK